MPCFHTSSYSPYLQQQNSALNPVVSSVIVYRFDDNVFSSVAGDSGLPKHGRRYYYDYFVTDKSLIQRHVEEEGVVGAATDWFQGCKGKFKPKRLQLLRLARASRSSNLFQILTKHGVNGVR